MKGYTYILKCSNNKYYTGSTTDLQRRFAQHQAGKGANFTRKNLPVELVYFEEFQRIYQAFTEKNKYKAGAEQKRKH